MPRQPNTAISGAPFDDKIIEAVWKKAKEEPGYVTFKRDACGAAIQRGAYGETTPYGWEIDHIRPVSKGGTDDLINLQPLQWENNRHKGDSCPRWDCKKES